MQPLQDKSGNNKYQRVMLAAKRARELAEGINLQPEMEGRKITTIAMNELDKGLLKRDDQKGEAGA
ncbi:MAG TPA: DNA-directed RNA polymerase subunit omega [bacterium]|jgi:DNA-directed RNA polymerase omega subunit|nr:DNA-directed RNA polymerase subunit omega [bacterium]HXB97832.1 DNA-directed RNA polymerase subunit omega [bacterium]HXC65228.1 DNA-directed RNA polymerase subunit omega [bacterium]